jgi:hypothetical protein
MIEAGLNRSPSPELLSEDKPIIAAVMQRKATVQEPKSPWEEWQKKNDWRTAGLLKFVGLTLPLEVIGVQTPVLPYKMLFELPSYCY